MGNLFFFISRITLEIFSIYTIYRLMRVFHKEAYYGRYMELGGYILFYGVIFQVIYIFVKTPVILLLINILILSVLSSQYESNLGKRALSITFICVLSVGVECLIGLLQLGESVQEISSMYFKSIQFLSVLEQEVGL